MKADGSKPQGPYGTKMTDNRRVAIEKFFVTAQQAGFSVDLIIELLESGMGLRDLRDLIAWQREMNAERSTWIGPNRNS